MLPPSLSPPPPPRGIDWVTDGNEEEIKEIVGGDSSNINECIPDEMLFEILLRLPAQDIYFGARLVCREWYNMMRTNNFVRKHFERASYGLLYMDGSENLVFISARDGGGIETYKINYKFNSDYNATKFSIWLSTWNGLMLEYNETENKLGYYNVKNISTGQAFRLPPFPYVLYYHWSCGIGYDAASTRYKVVVSFTKYKYESGLIFTLGVDKSWRTLYTQHLSIDGQQTLLGLPIITEGFMHWTGCGNSHVVTLSLETEIFAETPPPIPKVEAYTKCFSTGRCLTLFIKRGKLVWEALEMKPETTEWRKLTNICLEGNKDEIKWLGFKHDNVDIEPCGWLKYPEVLALRIRKHSIVFYNLITCEIGAEKLSTVSQVPWVTLHKNSLEWL